MLFPWLYVSAHKEVAVQERSSQWPRILVWHAIGSFIWRAFMNWLQSFSNTSLLKKTKRILSHIPQWTSDRSKVVTKYHDTEPLAAMKGEFQMNATRELFNLRLSVCKIRPDNFVLFSQNNQISALSMFVTSNKTKLSYMYMTWVCSNKVSILMLRCSTLLPHVRT